MECGDQNWQVFSMEAAHPKGPWNHVMPTLLLKDANNNIVHVAAAVKHLVQNVMKFHELRSVLSSESTTCALQTATRDPKQPSPPCVPLLIYVFFSDIYNKWTLPTT